MSDLLERLIRAASHSGVRGVLTALETHLGVRSAVFAMGGAPIEARPAQVSWGYQEVLAAGAKEHPGDGLHVFPIKNDAGTIIAFFSVEAPGGCAPTWRRRQS
ncbi:hypothetical protein [Leucobacter soli]|uniref:hypothetical protein n=1 Tax=Leucobacter soli TaxID=2812850 RepID=UPI003620E5DA